MKTKLLKKLTIVSLTLCLFSSMSMAEENVVASDATVISDTVKLIDIAGKQRMLSQRIAKDYLYAGKKISPAKANKQLKASLTELLSAHKILEIYQ